MKGNRFGRVTRGDLEAMRRGIAGRGRGISGSGLGPSLDDDLQQMHQHTSSGRSPEDWAEARGLPSAYARSLQRYLDQV